MLVPLSWMSTYAAFPNDVALLVAAFDDLGLVVESVERVGEGLESIVCATVVDIAAIEGADKVRAITVDAGDGPLGIVCGAWNFTVGDVVPLAPVGAVLPGGFAIAKRTMRGVESNGMLCSASELGVEGDSSGLLLLTDVAGATPGRPFAEVAGIAPDVLFELTAEGNRPDAWSMLGVVRDLAARLGLAVEVPSLGPTPPSSGVPTARDAAVVMAVERCQHLTVTSASGVVVGPSPNFVVDRLAKAGMRTINNVVDASNYVMLELGQPTHAYDRGRLAGGALAVRLATPGETLETLDGVTRTLGLAGRGLGDAGEDLVIADGEDHVVGIAGVMGGAATEIDDQTTSLVLEAACFDAMAIAKTSKKLGLRSEASNRFERGVDPAGAATATERFFEILHLSCPDLVVDRPSAVATGVVAPTTVLAAAPAAFAALLGFPVDADLVRRLLGPLGFGVEGEDPLLVTVPSNRPDIRPAPFGIADVAEEIVRTASYAGLTRTFPSWPTPGSLTARQRACRQLLAVLCGLGLDEVWTPTLVEPRTAGLAGQASIVTVANPLSAEEAALRTSLLPGVLAAIAYNADRRQDSVAFFEVGTVFEHPATASSPRRTRAGGGGGADALLPEERHHVLVALARPSDDAASAVATFAQLHPTLRLGAYRLVQPVPADHGLGSLAIGLHPTRSAAICCAVTGVPYGVVGEVDPAMVADAGLDGSRRVGIVALDLDTVLGGELAPADLHATAVSRFPSTEIDLAFTVEDTTAAASIRDALVEASGPLCTQCEVFDVYRGAGVAPGSRSLAFRLQFASLERTLTDAEVGEWRARAIAAATALGATLR